MKNCFDVVPPATTPVAPEVDTMMQSHDVAIRCGLVHRFRKTSVWIGSAERLRSRMYRLDPHSRLCETTRRKVSNR
jgi:hypothetical protein